MKKTQTIWKDRNENRGQYTETVNGVYLSYNQNYLAPEDIQGFEHLDSCNPETAIVIYDNETACGRRFLIYRGDRRKELEAIFPDVEKLKEHYREYGGHFFSDGLDE